jgi:hypothetical protein
MDPNQMNRQMKAIKVLADVETNLQALFEVNRCKEAGLPIPKLEKVQFSAYDERMLRCMRIKI